MNKLLIRVIVAVIVVLVVILGAYFLFGSNYVTTNKNLDLFAKCLAEKNVTMYGAEWCSHCQNEKSAFGESFKYVPYVECPDNPTECLAAGVESYPTWIFPDGKKLVGEQGIQKLSEESGCPLP